MVDEADRTWVGSMPAVYDRYLAPSVFRPFALDLAARAAALRPRRVLELAAGTGVLTAALVAANPDASVTATDLNPAMVEYGSTRVPTAHWRPADALDLPFGAGEFDLVICQFGVMFFPDRVAAFAEARRVLAPGGRLLFNTWGPADTHDFAAALMAGLERAFPDDPPAFVVAVPHGYTDPDTIAADLAAGGLDCTSADTVVLDGTAAAADDIAVGFCSGTPLRAAIEVRGDLDAATRTVTHEMRNRLGAGPVTGQMTAYVIEANPHT